jgi:hypothetical protein
VRDRNVPIALRIRRQASIGCRARHTDELWIRPRGRVPSSRCHSILKTAKPADLPVSLQSAKFEFVINLQTGASARDRRAANSARHRR